VTTVQVANINDTIKKLKEAGVWVVGTDVEATKYFYEYDYRQSVAIVIGNEGRGLRRLVKENCDELVKIPMAGKMSSLNASVASALLLFEVTRQRKWKTELPPTLPSATSIASSKRAWDYVPPAVYSSPTPLEASLAPPERDFFRSGPDSAFETPSEGPPEDMKPIEVKSEDTPDKNKGGGFHW
jgi:hypothetical protein